MNTFKKPLFIHWFYYISAVVCYWIAFALVFVHYYEQNKTLPTLGYALLGTCLLYPHITFGIQYFRTGFNERHERICMLFDVGLCGLFGNMIDIFSAPALLYCMLTMTNIMLAHGTKYFLMGTAVAFLNYAWAGLVMGFQFFQPVSFGLTVASGLLTLFYPIYLASVVHIRTKMLKNSKIKLREQKEMMQELNEELNQLNEEISTTLETVSAQKTEIQKQHFDITQSISYAKNIQEAFMPSLEFIAHTIPHSFILYRPRDIVSGDFYYINEHAGKIFIAAVDCTGHGIPGAFMSFLGNDLLTEIIVNRNTLEPDLILNKMSKGIRRVLRQAETNNRDGMDIALAVIDHQAKKLAYSGARNPLIYIQNQHLHTIKADIKSIGGEQREENKVFTKHIVDISLPTTFYLFTDGFQDQFGGKAHKKFMTASLRKKLLEIHQKPLPEQHNILNETLEQWITEGNERQTDDILLIGVKV